MEPETSAQSSPCLGEDHPWPLDFDEINTGFCDQSVTYSDVKAYRPSNVEKRKTTKNKNLKTNETAWCLVAMLFVFIYLIFLVLAAVMTAKARCLEEVLISYENETAHCKVI